MAAGEVKWFVDLSPIKHPEYGLECHSKNVTNVIFNTSVIPSMLPVYCV